MSGTALGPRFCGGQGRGAAHTRGGQQRGGCKHTDTLKARNHRMGAGWRGAGQDRTVLNRFSLKRFLGLQFSSLWLIFFFLYFHFFKKLHERAVECGLQEWWRFTLLVLFPLGPPSGGGGLGRRLPVNIWTWAGAGGCGAKPGVQAGDGRPSGRRPGESNSAPLAHHGTRQWAGNQNGRPGRGAAAIPSTPRPRSGSRQGGLWQPLSQVWS